MNRNRALRKAALIYIEGKEEKDICDADLSDSDSRYTTVEVDGTNYTIYMVGTDECFDVNEFYQYGITDDNHILKFYFNIPDSEDDFGNLDYNHAYRVVDDTDSWDYTDLRDYLYSQDDFKNMINDF